MFDILRRVKTIEEYIGIENEQAAGTTAEDFESSSARPEELEDDQTLEPLWRATAQLEASAPTRSRGSLWHRNMIKHLFQTVRGSAEVAEMAPQYFDVLCGAISQLTIPNSDIGTAPQNPADVEEWAFQTILGLILGGLLPEEYTRDGHLDIDCLSLDTRALPSP
ncbi:fungal transcriptional regulatory protein [Penicillium chermesinum]|nr:fungal transcriptional regulatory protein [Penicillium chermesinum]